MACCDNNFLHNLDIVNNNLYIDEYVGISTVNNSFQLPGNYYQIGSITLINGTPVAMVPAHCCRPNFVGGDPVWVVEAAARKERLLLAAAALANVHDRDSDSSHHHHGSHHRGGHHSDDSESTSSCRNWRPRRPLYRSVCGRACLTPTYATRESTLLELQARAY